MKIIASVLPFIYAIIGAILFNLSPVFAQVNSVGNSINPQISLELSDEQDTSNNINNEQAIPATNINTFDGKYSQGQIYLDKVTGVEQLQDVSPQHWAYEALRSLVEKYRCISTSGGEFNGSRAMTRY